MKIEVAELTEQDKKERNLPKVTFSFGGFKNLKIQINDQQPLDEVVKMLESKGYKPLNGFSIKQNHDWVVADQDGFLLSWRDASCLCDKYYPLTTLAELKEM